MLACIGIGNPKGDRLPLKNIVGIFIITSL